jgi:MYXO-CTERM domain-containing protein
VRHTTLATVACLLVCAESSAWAYVREVNDRQLPLFWASNCELVTVYLNGWTGLDETTIGKSAAAAAAAWGSTVQCPTASGTSTASPSFDIIVAPAPPGAVGTVGVDYSNKIVFVQSDWMYAEDALALTHHSSDSSGRIVDTDIEVNATRPDKVWTNLDPGASTVGGNGREVYDLQSVLTHEFGHFIGLSHTCFGGSNGGSDAESGTPIDKMDDQGLPIPECSDNGTSSNPASYASVMWYIVDPGSSAKRALTPDDVDAVCSMYPPSPSSVCPLNQQNDGCGCDSAGDARSGRGAVLLLGVCVVFCRRRRN